MSTPTPTLVPPGQGEQLWFLNNLFTVKADATQTGGGMTVIEFESPAGFGPPPHIHRVEDELFYVLAGEFTFWSDGAEATFGPGGVAFLPKGVPHRFEVGPAGPGRALQITTPAQFENLVREFGEPAGAPRLPEPTEPDVARLVETCRRYDIDILG